MEKSKKIYYNLRLIDLKSKNQIKREISQMMAANIPKRK